MSKIYEIKPFKFVITFIIRNYDSLEPFTEPLNSAFKTFKALQIFSKLVKYSVFFQMLKFNIYRTTLVSAHAYY